MDSDLLTSFLQTLKQVNETMTDLVATTAKHDVMLKFLYAFMILFIGAGMTWGFSLLLEVFKAKGVVS